MDYDNTAYDNGLDTQNIFKVNLAWKIFDFGATNDTYNSNYKLYLGAKSNYEYEKSKANVDLQLAIKAHKIAQMQIESTSLALKAANATYNAIESKYQSGLVNNVAYLEALSEKSNAISQLQNAKNNLEIKKANILYHSGKNLWEYVK
jgi:outer membrane protein TolC